jgi:hypothetical protein
MAGPSLHLKWMKKMKKLVNIEIVTESATGQKNFTISDQRLESHSGRWSPAF